MYASREGYTSQPMKEMSGMGGMAGMAGMPEMSNSPALSGGLTGILGGLAAGSPASLVPIKAQASVKHISDTGVCMDFGAIKKGDQLEIDAIYETSKYGLNKMMGKYSPLMGISVVYVAPA